MMKKIISIFLTLTVVLMGCSEEIVKEDKNVENDSTSDEVVENKLVCAGTNDGQALGSAYACATLEKNYTYEFDENDMVVYSVLEIKVVFKDDDHKRILIEANEQHESENSEGVTSTFEIFDDYLLLTTTFDYNIYNPEDHGMYYINKDDVIDEAEYFSLTCE